MKINRAKAGEGGGLRVVLAGSSARRWAAGLLAAGVALLGGPAAEAAARTASVTGSWTNTATWGGSAVPVAADTVTINNGITVTVPSSYTAVCTTVSFTTGSGASAINLNDATAGLTVSGAVTIQRNGSSSNSVNVGAGTFTAGSIALQGTTGGTRLSQILISTGTASTTGNITSAGVDSRIIFTGAGTLNIGGALLSGTVGTLTPSTGTVIYNSAAAQDIAGGSSVAYYNLTMSNSTKTAIADVAVDGVLTNTATLDMSTNLLTGAFSTAGGGVLQVRNTSSAPIPSGKTWNVKVTYLGSGAQTIMGGTYQGASPSLQMQNGSANTAAGDLIIGFGSFRIITPSSVDMNGYNLTFSGNQGGINRDATASFAPGSGTVTYDRSGVQTIWTTTAITYNHLAMTGSGVKNVPSGTVVTGNLSIAGATAGLADGINVPVGSLTLGGTNKISGTWGSTASAATYTDSGFFGSTLTGIITVSNDTRATPTVSPWPSASGITYGQALSNSTLSGGTPSAPGSFAFTSPSTTPTAGTYAASVTFTPTETTSFKTTSTNVNVAVAKANPTVTTWPTAAAITYGQTLASATLSGGSATPAGSFAFTTPTNVPPVGTAAYGVTYTPTDTNNYNTAANSASVTVNTKALSAVVTLNDKVYDGTTNATTIASRSLSGVVGSDDVNLGSSGVVGGFSSRNVGGYSVAVSGLSLSGATTGNYTLASATVTSSVSITARPITVTAATDSKTYDGTTSSTGTPALTSGTLGSGDTATGWTQSFSTKHAGTGKTLVPAGVVSDGNSGNNYSVTFANNTTGVIAARPLTVTAAANSKMYDGTTNAATAPTLTSGTVQSGDSASFVETYDTKHVGTGKTLTPSGTVTDGNSGNNYSYTFTPVAAGEITVRPLTITAAANSKAYDGTTSAATAPTISSGAVQSGDTANFVETYDTAAVGTGKTLTPSGTVTDGNGGNNYSYTFTPANNGTITAGSVSKLVFTTAPFNVATNVTSGTITVERQDAFGNPNTAEGARTVTLASDSSGTVTFTPASLTITSGASSASFTYKDTAPGWPTITASSAAPSVVTAATQQETVTGTAGSSTWDGGGADNKWSSKTNWTGNVAPAPGNLLYFTGSTRLTPSNDFPAGSAFTLIYFDSGASAFTLSGNQVAMDGGTVENVSPSAQNVALPISVSTGTTLKLRPAAGGGDLTLSGVISGEGGIRKEVLAGGVTKVILSGSNTYSGQTIFNSGIISINSIKDMGSSSPSSLGKPSAGNGMITMGAVEALNPTLIYTGPGDTTDREIDLYAGNVFLTHDGTGLLKFTGSFTASADVNHILTLNGSGTGEVASAVVNPATANTRLVKDGAGTWTLTGTNTYGGNTTISAGLLVVAGSGRLGSGNYAAGIVNNARLLYSSAATQTFGGALSGTGNLTMASSSTLTLSGAGTFSGSIFVSNGTVLANGALTGPVEVASSATLGGTGSLGSVRLRGGTLSPGLSPGTLYVSSLALTTGTYRVEVTNAAGVAGIDWDLINVGSGGGAVTNTATSGNPITIDLTCASSTLPGFYGSNSTSWTIIDAGTHEGFASNKFAISTLNFVPPQKYDGQFTVTSNAGNLVLNFLANTTNVVDLGVSVNAAPTVVYEGTLVTYMIQIMNHSSSMSGLFYVTNVLGGGFSYQSSSGGGSHSGGTVSWSLGGLAGGASTTLTLTVLSSAVTGSIQNVITISSPVSLDPNLSNNGQTNAVLGLGGQVIPTLSEWGMILLGVFLLALGMRHISRTCGEEAPAARA